MSWKERWGDWLVSVDGFGYAASPHVSVAPLAGVFMLVYKAAALSCNLRMMNVAIVVRWMYPAFASAPSSQVHSRWKHSNTQKTLLDPVLLIKLKMWNFGSTLLPCPKGAR